MGTDAFRNSGIERINLESIIHLNRYAFSDCKNLNIEVSMPNLRTWGTVSPTSSQFSNSGIVKITNLGMVDSLPNYFASGCASLEQVILHDGIQSISQEAFRNCTALTDAQLPESIVSMGSYAFANCPIENDINLPNLESLGSRCFNKTRIKKILSLGKITELSGAMFESCSLLEECILPETLITLGGYCFAGCVLKGIDIPASVTSIGDNCFGNNKYMTKTICRPTTPPTISSTSIDGYSTIYVPDDSLDLYKTATNWSKYANRIKRISELQ